MENKDFNETNENRSELNEQAQLEPDISASIEKGEEETIVMPKKKRRISKQVRNYIFFGILIAAVTALTLFFLLKENPGEVLNILSRAKILPVLAIVGLVLGMIFVEGLVLTVITRLYNKKYNVFQGTVNGLIGSFFSNVTPFASGGQFVQAFTFTRQGVKAANGASILVMHFIVYQTVLLLYAIVAFIVGFDTIKSLKNIELFGITFSPIILSIVGFCINSFTIVSLFFLAFCSPLHRLILNSGINLLNKMHLIKNPEAKRTKLINQVASFRVEFKRLITNYRVLITVFLLFVVKFTLLYSIPYFAGMANKVDMSGKYFDSLFASSYLAMITSFIPIPGGSGGAELGFQALYASIFGSSSITTASNILWRGLTYYLVTLIGGITFALYRGKPSAVTQKVADTQTFKDLNLTPFIRHSKNIEMLEKRYARLDEKEKVKLMSKEDVLKSFEDISTTLSTASKEEASINDDNDLLVDSKKDLANVLIETDTIEKNSYDEEIQRAVKHDEEMLNKAKQRKEQRKERRRK